MFVLPMSLAAAVTIRVGLLAPASGPNADANRTSLSSALLRGRLPLFLPRYSRTYCFALTMTTSEVVRAAATTRCSLRLTTGLYTVTAAVSRGGKDTSPSFLSPFRPPQKKHQRHNCCLTGGGSYGTYTLTITPYMVLMMLRMRHLQRRPPSFCSALRDNTTIAAWRLFSTCCIFPPQFCAISGRKISRFPASLRCDATIHPCLPHPPTLRS